MPQVYDLQKIRTLLNEGFIAEELIDFCRIVPEFQPLYEQQLNTLPETELIDRLVTHARDVSQLEKLLAWAKKRNPIQYAAHEPYTIAKVPEDIESSVRAVAQQAQISANLSAQTTTTDSSLSDKKASKVTIGAIGGSIENTTIAGRDVERTSVRQVVRNVFRGSKRRSPSQRNRQAMLKRVRSFWVEGMLEKSLHGLAMIELGMAEKGDAVDDPLNLTLKTTDQPDKMLPDGTPINDIFNEMDRALLILGEPGSGKTMSLLSLARDAIAEAEADPTKPIPVVFNLSSWSTNKKPIGEWLVDEFRVKYQIPAKISEVWIENRDLLLLLDGLDEVAKDERNTCVEAINTFSQDYGRRNIVVCSRIADYEALTAQLKLQGAVLLQPLTSKQVDEYLNQAGDQLQAVTTLIGEDEVLRELTRSPLTLSIMTLAYRGMSVEELRGYGSVEERRAHLFDTYVDKMFHRNVRTKQETSYSNELTIGWLSWLAQKMSQHDQSMFLLEQMQPSWLSGISFGAYFLFSRIIAGLIIWGSLFTIIIATFGMIFWSKGGTIAESLRNRTLSDHILLTWKDITLNEWFVVILFGGIIVGGAVGIIDIIRSKTTARARVVNFLFIAAVVGSIPAIYLNKFIFASSSADSVISATLMPIIVLIICGVLFGIFFALKNEGVNPHEDIQTVEALSWSFEKGIRSLFQTEKIVIPVIIVLEFILTGSLILYRSTGPMSARIGSLPACLILRFSEITDSCGMDVTQNLWIIPLVIAVTGSLAFGAGGLQSRIMDMKTTVNQGIKLSLRNAFFVGFIFTLIYVLLAFVISINFALILGISVGVLAFMWFGGLDVIRHFILRLMIYIGGRTPRNYADFLDYAQERIFVQKIGGGFVFLHRLLLEHFAQRDIPSSTFPNKTGYVAVLGVIIVVLLPFVLSTSVGGNTSGDVIREIPQTISVGETKTGTMRFNESVQWTFEGKAGQFIELEIVANHALNHAVIPTIIGPGGETVLGFLRAPSVHYQYFRPKFPPIEDSTGQTLVSPDSVPGYDPEYGNEYGYLVMLANRSDVISKFDIYEFKNNECEGCEDIFGRFDTSLEPLLRTAHSPESVSAIGSEKDILLPKNGTYTLTLQSVANYNPSDYHQFVEAPFFKLLFGDTFDYTLSLKNQIVE